MSFPFPGSPSICTFGFTTRFASAIGCFAGPWFSFVTRLGYEHEERRRSKCLLTEFSFRVVYVVGGSRTWPAAVVVDGVLCAWSIGT